MPVVRNLNLSSNQCDIDPWTASPVSSSIDYILDSNEQSSEIRADSDILVTPKSVPTFSRNESAFNPFEIKNNQKDICEDVLKELQYSAVELSIECRDLMKIDFFARHDSFAVIMTAGKVSGTWEELDRSEVVKNCDSPRYVKKFRIPASSKLDQDTTYVVRIYTATSNMSALRDTDILGCTSFSISALLDSSQMDCTSDLISPRSGKKKGDIILSLDTIHHVQGSETIIFDIGVLLAATCKDQFEFVVSRTLKHGRFFPVYRSEVQSGQLCSKFNDAEISAQALHGGDPHALFRVEMHRQAKDGRSEMLGYVQLSLERLKACSPGTALYWWSTKTGMPLLHMKIMNLRVQNGCQWYMMRLMKRESVIPMGGNVNAVQNE